MRLNVNKYLGLIKKRGIDEETVRKAVGLSERTYHWMLENQSIEGSTLELIADVIGCKISEIYLPDAMSNAENVIEWTRDGKRATMTFSQSRYITRIKKLAKEHPQECQIVAENEDGSICAYVPVKWVRINPPRQYTEEQRQEMGERLNGNTSK